jgi:phytoene dehydrogenase-like protein
MSAVVIGGGLAGLSAALTLQEAGEEVELFEASDSVGGRLRSDYLDGFILDHGFQLINSGYPEIKRLGVISEIDFVKSDRTIDVVTPFGIQPIGDPRLHLLQGLRSPLGSFREKIAFLTFMGSRKLQGKNLEEALLDEGTLNLYHNLLKPFLTGVFLVSPNQIDANYGQEIIKSFIVGDSGLPIAGVGVLAEAIAARIEKIHLNSPITDLEQFKGRPLIVAIDHHAASTLLGLKSHVSFARSFTWYHSIPSGLITSKRLRVTSTQSPIINSIALSNVMPSYAPDNRTLISTTTLEDIDESSIKDHLSRFWSIDAELFELIKRYEINDALPIFSPTDSGRALSAKVSDGIYRAGDYLTAASQNGALLSGRLAAQELLFDKS